MHELQGTSGAELAVERRGTGEERGREGERAKQSSHLCCSRSRSGFQSSSAPWQLEKVGTASVIRHTRDTDRHTHRPSLRRGLSWLWDGEKIAGLNLLCNIFSAASLLYSAILQRHLVYRRHGNGLLSAPSDSWASQTSLFISELPSLCRLKLVTVSCYVIAILYTLSGWRRVFTSLILFTILNAPSSLALLLKWWLFFTWRHRFIGLQQQKQIFCYLPLDFAAVCGIDCCNQQ